jgi:hypothetical protein
MFKHSLPDGVWFAEPDEVQLRMLKTLHQNRVVPLDISVVVMDTEGGDLDIIRGMGKATYHAVMVKFWDGKHRFSQEKIGLLEQTVAEMRRHGYGWHIVIYRVFDGESTSSARYFANIDRSVEQSSGFAIFFRDYSLFAEALKWCSSNLRQNESFR